VGLKKMKYLYFLLFAILIWGIYQYVSHISPMQEIVEEKIPSPDELWKKQQAEGKLPVGLESPLFNSEVIVPNLKTQEEMVQPKVLIDNKEIIAEKPMTVVDAIPTPDELWEQQYQDNGENEIPATVLEHPVISDEQRKAEALENSIVKEDVTNDPLEYREETDEFPASDLLVDVIPFELRELEASSNINQNTDDEYSEPLIDPKTGISDQELMKQKDVEPAIELGQPVDVAK
jgi:hypothetical protein